MKGILDNQTVRTVINQLSIIRLRKRLFLIDLAKHIFGRFGTILTILATALTIIQVVEGPINHNGIIIYGVAVTFNTLMFVVLMFAIVWALIEVWPKTTTRIKHKDVEIKVEVCDLFEQSGLKVIHTTDTFDMDRIKEGTVVANFVTKCQEKGFDIKNVISKNIHRCRYVESDNSLPGLKDRYELGTVCFFNSVPDDSVVSKDFSSFCLVAFSHIHPGYVDSISIQEYINTLNTMWKNLSVPGKRNDNIVNITVIGDKQLRLPTDCNFTQKIALIVETFLNASHEKKICDKLRICITDEDMAKIDFQKFDAVMKFLSERSEFLPIQNQNK